MSANADYSYRGLIKLMLKMPALRGRLQILSVRNPDILVLCGAFEEASITLETLIKERDDSNKYRIEEYQIICKEIEDEILEICYKS